MPLPNALRSVIHDPAFWSDFFAEGIYDNTYPSLVDPSLNPGFADPTIPIVFSITPRHRLRLLLDVNLHGFRLELLGTREKPKTTVAYNSLDGHPFPWGLRWEEVDLFGRCLALQDPDWSHPGLLVLLLSRTAPVTTDQDAGLAFPLLESAWTSLGLFSPARTNFLISGPDRRLSSMFWRFEEPHGWELRHGYSIRTFGDYTFSCSAWKQFVKDAEELACGLVNPERFVRTRANVETVALAIAETADWDKAPALADALEETGCRQAAVLGALRSGVPAQVLWALELLLGEPQGRLIRRHLGSATRPLEATHLLEVQFPDMKDRQLIREFQQTLFEQGFGSTCWTGGICFPLPENTAQDAFDTTLVGDTEQGLEAIRRLFARYGPPAGTAIYSWKEHYHLSLVPGAGYAPDPRAVIEKGQSDAGVPYVTVWTPRGPRVVIEKAESDTGPSESAPSALDLEMEGVLAKLATRPMWIRTEKEDFLTWIEYHTKDDQEVGTRVMQWRPQTEQERDAAQRFYEVSNRKSYEDLQGLFNQPRQPGQYVVRSGLGGYYSYLAGKEDGFTDNVREALVLTHDGAIRAVLRLAKEQPIRLEHRVHGPPIIYWEAMRLDDAIVCHDQFARAASRANSPGVPKDKAEAGLGFGRVADPGDLSEWRGIASGHMSGRSLLPHDPAAAVRWYRQAAEHGDALAQTCLGMCYFEGLGVPRDDGEAVRWYRLAARQGQASGQLNLGWMYERGRGVAQDYGEALRWYSLAAGQGNVWAQCNLGEMYQRALGVERDDTEAVRWFRLSADAGHAEAQYDLGWMYEQGRGVPQDLGEALRLYRLAADQCVPAAVEAVKRLSSPDSEE